MPFMSSEHSQLLDKVPTLSAPEFEHALSGIREQLAITLGQKSGLDISVLLTNAYFPIAQAIVRDDDFNRRKEKGERLTRIIRQDIYRIIGEHPLDNTIRDLLLQFLRRISPETSPDPTPLPYRILPPGEGFIPEETGQGKETNVNPIDHPRVEWGLDIAKTFDRAFDPSCHFFVSQLDTDVKQEPYHAILFPSFGRCVFVCNTYGNATYLVPIDQWEDWAKNHKIEDLRQAAQEYKQNSSQLQITWFPMQESEVSWRVRLVSELLSKPAQKPIAKKTVSEDKSFEEWLQMVLDFYVQHKKWPSMYAPDAEEKKLRQKLQYWREGFRNEQLLSQGEKMKGHERLSPDHTRKILAAGIVLDPATVEEARFQDDLKACVVHFESYSKWPSKCSTSPEERRLSIKMQGWRVGYKNEKLRKAGLQPKNVTRLSDEHAQHILQAKIILDIPGKKDMQLREDLEACTAFFQEHRFWPRAWVDDPQEKKLGRRIDTWRQGYRMEELIQQGIKPKGAVRLTEEHRQLILATGISLDPRIEDERFFQEEMQACVRHLETRGKLPSVDSKDPEERRLGFKIQTWRQGFRNEQLLMQGMTPKSTPRLSIDHQRHLIAAGIIKPDLAHSST